MFSAALLALALSHPQDGPLPLSPEKLLPPPLPLMKEDPSAVNLHFESNYLEAPIQECRQRALAAVAAQEGFVHAHITAEGHIAGYTRNSRVLVLLDPGINGINYYIAVASRAREAESPARDINFRFRNRAVEPYLEKTAGRPDPFLERSLLPIAWHIDVRPSSDMFRFYTGAACLLLAKQGFRGEVIGNGEGALLVKEEKVATAIRIFRDREFRRPSEESPRVIQRERTPIPEFSRQLLMMRLGSGERNETVKAYLITTGNTIDVRTATGQLRAVCAATGRLVFE